MSDENSLSEGGVPDEFWSVPEAFIQSAELRLLHAETCSRLRLENPDADTLELMAIERVASLYFYMRFKEQTTSFKSDTAYKGMMTLWVTMAADLRKTRLGSADEASIRHEVVQDVARTIKDALKGLEPEVQFTVRQRLQERLGA